MERTPPPKKTIKIHYLYFRYNRLIRTHPSTPSPSLRKTAWIRREPTKNTHGIKCPVCTSGRGTGIGYFVFFEALLSVTQHWLVLLGEISTSGYCFFLSRNAHRIRQYSGRYTFNVANFDNAFTLKCKIN